MFEGVIWRKFIFVPGCSDDGSPDWGYGVCSLKGSQVWWNQGQRGIVLRPPGLLLSVSRSHACLWRCKGNRLDLIWGIKTRRMRLLEMRARALAGLAE